MEYEGIQQIAIVYGKKDLVEYFVEQFNWSRLHDGAEVKAILVKNNPHSWFKYQNSTYVS